MAKTKDIQRRIKSVASTKKITRAMEMVAAAKMRKAVEAALATRTYANLSWETLLHVAETKNGQGVHPLLEKPKEVKRQAIVVITSNRGLCGGFNSALLTEVKQAARQDDSKTDLVLVGRKGEVLASEFEVSARFPKEEALIDSSSVTALAKFIMEGFIEKKYDQVLVAYTDFINAVKQSSRIRQLLPIETRPTDGAFGLFDRDDKVGLTPEMLESKEKKHLSGQGLSYEYTFEPSAHEVLKTVAPRLVEVQLLQAMLESSASEHSARMSAMHQATKAAGDLVGELTLFYNKARQASITGEIAEITAGVAALE